MKTKIFNALKQEYLNLGLGDEIIQGQADSLAATGLVTDENLDNIVKGQKHFLSSLQSGIDRRVTTATDKVKKEYEEKTKGPGATPPTTEPNTDNDLDAKIAALLATHVKPLQDKLSAYEIKEQQASRQNFITNTAKELDIPEWRTKEGFAIAPDADEATIKTTLSSIKQNIVTAGLERTSGFPISDKEPTQDEIKEISSLI